MVESWVGMRDDGIGRARRNGLCYYGTSQSKKDKVHTDG